MTSRHALPRSSRRTGRGPAVDDLGPADRYWWSSRVCVIADRPDWAVHAVELCHLRGAHPEILSWSDAEDLGGPVGAILGQVDRPGERKFELFRMWSGRAWQPLCVVSCAPVRGMARLESFLDEMGFPPVFHDDVGTDYWTELQASLVRVLERRAWLVTLFADALDSRDPKFVRVLATLVLADDPIVTVRRWADQQGMGYRELEALTSDRGLPSPKHLLDRVRMGLAVVYASVDHNPSREELARRLRYSSGDYLGRQAKRLTGLPFGVLVQRGVPATMRTLFPPRGD